jgi:hypothetical protein
LFCERLLQDLERLLHATTTARQDRVPSGTLGALTCGGSSWPYAVQTVKGISYALFTAITGTCRAMYG